MTVDWTKPIVDNNGKPARVISEDYRVDGKKVRLVQVEWNNNSSTKIVGDDGVDLFVARSYVRNRKTKHEGWVNLYRSPEGDIQSGMRTWTSEEAAKEAAAHRKDHIVTTKFEWEE